MPLGCRHFTDLLGVLLRAFAFRATPCNDDAVVFMKLCRTCVALRGVILHVLGVAVCKIDVAVYRIDVAVCEIDAYVLVLGAHCLKL